MNLPMNLPEELCALIGDAAYKEEDIGKSGSCVLCFESMVLKIEPATAGFDASVAMMRWLEDKLPVPKVLYAGQEAGMQYLLMSRVRGKMACDSAYTADTDALAGMLADALKTLWQVDISQCPKERHLEDDLAEARYRVANNLIDLEDTEPETFCEGGFEDPAQLLQWLEENQPPLEPVLSHGDFCLPNVFFENGKLSGFIDLGDTGISDKWRDIALCWRSLKHNIAGKYATAPDPDFSPDILFEKLGITPDWRKLRYYLLLDELF